jgi:hypothetical protein
MSTPAQRKFHLTGRFYNLLQEVAAVNGYTMTGLLAEIVIHALNDPNHPLLKQDPLAKESTAQALAEFKIYPRRRPTL